MCLLLDSPCRVEGAWRIESPRIKPLGIILIKIYTSCDIYSIIIPITRKSALLFSKARFRVKTVLLFIGMRWARPVAN
jgi:hypothetical protein